MRLRFPNISKFCWVTPACTNLPTTDKPLLASPLRKYVWDRPIIDTYKVYMDV